MRVLLVGLGAVGAATARQLLRNPRLERLSVVDRDSDRAAHVVERLSCPERIEVVGGGLSDLGGPLSRSDVLILAISPEVRSVAAAALAQGVHVVSTGDDPVVVRSLLSFDAEARARGLAVVAGACLAPGLSCVIARFAADQLDAVEEVHVASVGTGGPACARRHHTALSSTALEWRDGQWRRRPAGSGRELLWFPEPVGGTDCYRAAVADPLLLMPAFPGVRRVTVRMSASRRDRMTAWLPMLRRPHPEGTVGAVRAEVRGWKGGRAEVRVFGASVRPALGAASVAALAAGWAVDGRLSRSGAGGLAGLVGDPKAFLQDLAAYGINVAVFEGSAGGPSSTGF